MQRKARRFYPFPPHEFPPGRAASARKNVSCAVPWGIACSVPAFADGGGAVPSDQTNPPAPIEVEGPESVLGKVGEAVNASWTATGGSGSYTWSCEDEFLPAGLSFANGVLSGTPTRPTDGTVSIGVTATDASLSDYEGSAFFSLTIAPADPYVPPSPPYVAPDPLVLDPAGAELSLVEGMQMEPFAFTVSGGRSSDSLTWTMEGAPEGLTISPASDGRSATLSGAPAEAGEFTATLIVSAGRAAPEPVSATLAFVVEPAPDPLVLNGERALKAPVDQERSFSFQAEGGKAPYTYDIKWNQAVPTGVSFDAETGTFSINSQQAGLSLFVVSVTDAYGTQASLLGSLEIVNFSALTITPNNVTVYSGTFRETFTASGGYLASGEKYQWSLDWADNVIPDNERFRFSAAHDGKTATASLSDYVVSFRAILTVAVKDSLGNTATATITLDPHSIKNFLDPPQNEGDGTGQNLIVNREPLRQDFPSIGGGSWSVEGPFPPGTIIDDNPYIPTPENVTAAMGAIFGEVEVAKKEPNPEVAYGHKYVLKDAEGNPHQPGDWITIDGKEYYIYDVYEDADGDMWFKLRSGSNHYEVKKEDLGSLNLISGIGSDWLSDISGAFILVDGVRCVVGAGVYNINGGGFLAPVIDPSGRFVGSLSVEPEVLYSEAGATGNYWVDENGWMIPDEVRSYTPHQTPLGEQYEGTTEDGKDFEVTLVGSTDLTPVAPDGTIAQSEGNVQVSQTIRFDELTAVYDQEEGAEASSKVENAIIAMQNIHNGISQLNTAFLKKVDQEFRDLQENIVQKIARATVSQTADGAYEVSAAFPGMSPFVTYVITGEAVDDLLAQSEQETPADSTQTPSAPAATETRPTTYTVRAGDTLSQLAERFGTTVDALVSANAHLIRDPNLILTGWLIAIP